MRLGKRDKFVSYFSDISKNLKVCVDLFAEYQINGKSDLKELAEKMKEIESNGDTLVHEVIKELNHAFITPIDREDILLLAMKLDDVLDGIENTGSLLHMYSINNADVYRQKFVEAIQKSVNEIALAIELLSTKKLESIKHHVIRIKEIESECDEILRESIKNLFQVEKDPIRLIQYKEIYEELEEISDYCQSVANTLETIIMKNS